MMPEAFLRPKPSVPYHPDQAVPAGLGLFPVRVVYGDLTQRT